MKAEHEGNLLVIEKAPSLPGRLVLRFESRMDEPGWASSVIDHQIEIEDAALAAQEAARFASADLQTLELFPSGTGWLRFRRSAQGHIVVRYRAVRPSLGAAVEGEHIIQAAGAARFCAELQALFCH